MTGVTGRRILALAALLGVVVATVSALPLSSTAAPAGIQCSTGSEARKPVVLVHGFNSGPQTWSDSTRKYLARASSKTCIDVFNYANTSDEWVTDPTIGPALARRIDQLSKAFKRGGGDGKVIVVAHSMGGLATRCASSAGCNGGIDGIAGRIAEVITFGTPNLGAYALDKGSNVQRTAGWILSTTCNVRGNHGNPICKQIRALGTSDATRAFKPGSDQLRRLPAFPASVPVYALAARIDMHSSFFGLNDTNLGSVGDGIVGERSALIAGRRLGDLGGQQVIDCGKIDGTNLVFGTRYSCWHSTETNDQRFLEAAAHQIKMASVVAPPPIPGLGRVWRGVVPGSDIRATARQLGSNAIVSTSRCPPVAFLFGLTNWPVIVAPDGRHISFVEIYDNSDQVGETMEGVRSPSMASIVGPAGIRAGQPISRYKVLTSAKQVVKKFAGSSEYLFDPYWILKVNDRLYFYVRADVQTRIISTFGWTATLGAADGRGRTQGGCF